MPLIFRSRFCGKARSRGKNSLKNYASVNQEFMNILFVCTGNMCRSPIAEHMLKKMLQDLKDKKVLVKSAGVEPSTWMEMPPEVKKVLEKEGITVTKHAAQGLTDENVKEADMILVMEEYHRTVVTHRFPAA